MLEASLSPRWMFICLCGLSLTDKQNKMLCCSYILVSGGYETITLLILAAKIMYKLRGVARLVHDAV